MATSTGKLRLYSGYATDKGEVRERNEDALIHRKIPLGYFAAIADGLGGHEDGDKAAALTLAMLVNELDKENDDPVEGLQRGFERANNLLRRKSDEDHKIMGATCVAAVVSSGRLYVAHVGDSRLYMLRGANLYALTRDHSILQEIADLKGPNVANSFDPHLKHIMSKSVGAEDEIHPSFRPPVALETGDAIMLCSDGVSGVVDESLIRRILAGNTAREAAIRLVEMAMEASGQDNASAIVLRVDTDLVIHDQTQILLDELIGMPVKTPNGDVHPVMDVILNPFTWSVAALRLDLSAAQPGATCEISISDIGPMAGQDSFISTPMRTEALLDLFKAGRT